MNTALSAPLTGAQKLLWLLFCLAFFAALYFAIRHVRQMQLESELNTALLTAEQRSPGWRFAELEAVRGPVSDDENSAFIVQRASRCLPADRPAFSLSLPIFGRNFTTEPLNPQEDLILTAELDQLILALAEARDLAEWPRGRFPLRYDPQPWKILLPHFDQVSRVSNLLVLDVVHRCEQKDFAEAIHSCRAAVNAASSLGDEPFTVTQALRRARTLHACRALHYLLNHTVVEPRTLADFQKQIEAEIKHPAFVLAMRGERAMIHAEIEAVESGALDYWEIKGGGRGGNLPPLWAWRPNLDDVRRQHVALIPILDRLVELAEIPAHERSDYRRQIQAERRSEDVNLLAHLLGPLRDTEMTFTRHEVWLNCYHVAVAVERYRILHDGNWPQTLDALTPELLKQVPLDAADGHPLRYQLLPDGVVISSLYPDHYRQVYEFDERTGVEYGVAVRLWNVSERGKRRE